MERCCRFSLLILECAEWHFLIVVSISTLPHDTIAALQDFYHERDQRQQHFDDLKAQVHQNSKTPLSMEMFSEDWNASQFWVCPNYVVRLICRYLIVLSIMMRPPLFWLNNYLMVLRRQCRLLLSRPLVSSYN